MKRRSQMEIMGIAIVVVLLTFALLFVFKYVVTKKPVDYRTSFTQVELASNTVNTLLATTVNNCNGRSFEQAFLECAERGLFGGQCNDNLCFLVDQVDSILEETLDTWKIQYEFTAITNADDPIMKLTSETPCSATSDRKTKQFPLPGAVPVNVILAICSN